MSAYSVSLAFWQAKLLAAARGRWRSLEELVTRTGYALRHVVWLVKRLVTANLLEVSQAEEQPVRYRARRLGP